MIIRTDKKIARNLLFIACSLFFSQSATSQVLAPNLPQNKQLALAEDQYYQKHYKEAVQSAQNYLAQTGLEISYPHKDKANFIITVASLKLEQQDAPEKALEYIASTANPTYKQRTAYALGQYYFRNNMYAEAIPYYEMADISNLSNAEIANEKFELAYCYFSNNELNRAEPLLASIKEISGSYFKEGNYYYGLLAYNQNRYEEALKSFERIANEKDYKDIVPYYIAEIYYFTNNKQKALSEATRLIRSVEKSFYDNELHLLAGQILFEEKRYKDALPFFEHYYDNTDKIRKEDLYEMGYCYYKLGKWQNAIDKFKLLSDTRDSLGQTSMYLLGDCYLNTLDKKSARNAFSICADMPFNQELKEAALLLSARLSYEMGYNGEAVYFLNSLIADFPNSQYSDEAKTLLSDLLIRTRNYKEAFAALEDVQQRDQEFKKVYQKVAYGYAIQKIQSGDIEAADQLLTEALKYSVDETYTTATYFWKGELAYRLNNYTQVVQYTQKFMNADVGRRAVEELSPSATMSNAYLNMGYAATELKEYDKAQKYFNNSYALNTNSADSTVMLNALLREADALFMQKSYDSAIAKYNTVIAQHSLDYDYAQFQKATILGLQDRNREKESILKELTSNSSSVYATDARYELALTYIEEDKYKQAISTLMPLTEAYERRNMAPRAWMKIGFAYQQLNNTDKAIESYKRIIEEYSSSTERVAALDALKSLYIQSGKPELYADLLKKNNLGSVDENTLDSTYYATAEAQYSSEKYEGAIQALNEYLNKFPNGAFVNKANYYKAESYIQLKQYDKALEGYDAVLQNPWSDFSENSAKKAAAIAFQNKDYEQAIKYYNALQNNAMSTENIQLSYSRLTQAHYNLAEYKKTILYTDTLLSLPGIGENAKMEAQLLKARSLQKTEQYAEALSIYKSLTTATKAATSAEARYQIADIYFVQGKIKEAEEAANSTIQNAEGQDYWIVKSYILLSDILVKQKDYFNAKATLQSIVKNTKITELKEIASERLKEATALEKKNSKLSE